jgi:hypothetical protein
LDFEKAGNAFKQATSHPFWFITCIIAFLAYVYIDRVLPQQAADEKEFRDKYLASQVEQVKLQAQLEALNAQEVKELVPIAQQYVDAQDPHEAWLKNYDYDTGKWLLVVVNSSYTEMFGIGSEQSKGKTAYEAYLEQRPELKEATATLLKQYQVNDNRAAKVRNKCLVFDEWVIPLNEEPEKRRYKKCRMTSGQLLLMYGERIDD